MRATATSNDDEEGRKSLMAERGAHLKEIARSLTTGYDEKVTPKYTPYEKVELIERKASKAMRLLASQDIIDPNFRGF